MNTGGVILIIVGIWGLTQIFKGQMLQRLGLIPTGG